VCAIQNQANQGHDPNNQTNDNHYAQSVGFSFMSVIDGNDGVQQMIDVASINLAYDELHAVSPARIRPSQEGQTGTYQRVVT
jgi:hypothetical protein